MYRSRLRCCWCWEAETGGCLHTRGWSFIKHWRAEVHLSGTTGHNKLHKDNLTVWALPHWFYSYSTQSFLSFISLKSGCCGFLKMDILCPEWTHRLTASSTQRCGCTSISDHAHTHVRTHSHEAVFVVFFLLQLDALRKVVEIWFLIKAENLKHRRLFNN